MLILSGENGFVCHHKSSNTLDANRSVYDIFWLIFNDGAYNIKSQCTCRSVVSHLRGTNTKLNPSGCRCNWEVLVRLQQRSGVFRRRKARGLFP